MRIAQIVGSIDPRRGGKEQLVRELAQELVKLGHQVTLVICDRDANVRVSYDVRYVSAKKISGIPWIPSLNDLIKHLNSGFDICHLHYHSIFGEIVAFACRICNIPMVTTFWDEMKRGVHKMFYDRVTLYSISRLSDRIICLSEGQENVFVRRGVERHKIRIIPVAIYVRELLHHQANTSARPTRNKGEHELLFVGRLDERKGLQFLLKALVILREGGVTPKLKVIGDGICRNQLLSYIRRYGLSSQVTFTGYMTRENIFESYQQCKCVIVPSLYEGIPRVTLEAMACGKPIVATSIPGLEVINQKRLGILVPPKDPESLADAILQVLSLSPKDLKGIELRAKETVERYSWSSVVDEIISVYEDVCVTR